MVITRENTKIELTAQEMVAAFFEQQKNFCKEDAALQLAIFFDYDDSKYESPTEDRKMCAAFLKRMGFAYADAIEKSSEYYSLDYLADTFLEHQDANEGENDVWNSIIFDKYANDPSWQISNTDAAIDLLDYISEALDHHGRDELSVDLDSEYRTISVNICSDTGHIPLYADIAHIDHIDVDALTSGLKEMGVAFYLE